MLGQIVEQIPRRTAVEELVTFCSTEARINDRIVFFSRILNEDNRC
jgi:hypothetical protein